LLKVQINKIAAKSLIVFIILFSYFKFIGFNVSIYLAFPEHSHYQDLTQGIFHNF